MRVAPAIHLSAEQRDHLLSVARAKLTPQRLATRCRVVLLADEGLQDLEISVHLGLTRQSAARWRARYLAGGFESLAKDKPGRGRKKTLPADLATEIVRRTTQPPPTQQAWSTRTLAKALGVSATTVRQVWQQHGLKPHLAKTFKVSNDPQFAERLDDIVGLYLNRPEHALVFSCDEKSQIQALDRTQPGLPLKRGRAETFTHDYVRHGTTTLFAALNVADGKIISTCQPRHRHQEWLKFLQLIERSTPPERELHLILDNYATHKHPKVKAWLAEHPRFHLHFTPTSASWLNMVERFFRELTNKRLRRTAFKSLPDLIAAVNAYVEHHNAAPSPFIWTAKAADILAKVQRARAALPNS